MSEVGVLILEITVIVLAVSFVLFILGRYIYKRVKGLPTGECECCHKGVKKMLKEYHKTYSNK